MAFPTAAASTATKFQMVDPVRLLREALDERCRKNPRYSIRAFARASGISVTVLSLVLSGKRRLSKKATAKLADFLNLDPVKRKALLGLQQKTAQKFQDLSLETFSVISDWHHYAILSALELQDAQFEPRWLAKTLNISYIDAKLAMERLQSLNLVAQQTDGKWRQTGHPIKIDNSQSTAATRKFHKQLLQKATESIEKDPVPERDFSAMTFAMDPTLVEYARKKIQKFRRELTTELEMKSQPGAVYQMTIQLFPLSNLTTKGEKNENQIIKRRAVSVAGHNKHQGFFRK